MIYNIIAIPRSGHTAIMFWMARQNNLETVYLGDVGHYHDEGRHYSLQQTDKTVCFCPHNKNARPIKVRTWLGKEIYIDSQAKDLNKITDGIKYPYEFPYKVDYNIIVLRDCFNNLASLVAQRTDHTNLDNDLLVLKEIWKTHAREYLGLTNHLEYKSFILYNKWVLSKRYRKSLCKKYDMTFTDIGYDKIPHNGGMSFSSITYFNRFNEIFNEVYNSIIDDKELVELNNKIFNVYGPKIVHKYYPKWYKLIGRI